MLQRKVGQGNHQNPLRSASFVNDLTDIASAFRDGSIKNRPPQSMPTGPVPVRFKNSTEAQLLRGHVVALTDYLLVSDDDTPTPFNDDGTLRDGVHPWFKGIATAEDNPNDTIYAIVENATPEDAMGVAILGGMCIVRVTVNKQTDRWAYLRADEQALKTGACGQAKLLTTFGADDEGEEREAWAWFGVNQVWIGKVVADQSPRQESGTLYSGKVKIWAPVGPLHTDGDDSDSQPEELPADAMDCWPWLMPDDHKFVNGDEVEVTYSGVRLIVVNSMQCLIAVS